MMLYSKAWNFNVDLCRSLTLEKYGEGEVHGIKTDRSNRIIQILNNKRNFFNLNFVFIYPDLTNLKH